jgi:hypothetical protein
MTGRTEDRLRDATAAVGRLVEAADIPELRLPERIVPGRSRMAHGQRRPRLGAVQRWLIPLAAAAAMLVLIGTLVYAGRIGPRRPSVPAPPAVPAFVVTSQQGRAAVRSSATGAVIARIAPPARYAEIDAVAAVPGDRIFYLAAQLPATRGLRIEFFRITLAADGRPGPAFRLPGAPLLVPLPITSDALMTIPLAVSPDGSRLAFGSADQFYPDDYAASHPASVTVQRISTGSQHTWTVWSNSLTQIGQLSWTAGHRLGIIATIGDAAIRHGWLLREPRHALNVFLLLNTEAAGHNLIADSRLVAYGSQTVAANGSMAPIPGPDAGLISADGRTAYLFEHTASSVPELVRIDMTTGRVSRVLLRGAIAAQSGPIAIEGATLLVPLNLRHHAASNLYIAGHLVGLDGRTGGVAVLPIPLYYAVPAPLPPVLAAW